MYWKYAYCTWDVHKLGKRDGFCVVYFFVVLFLWCRCQRKLLLPMLLLLMLLLLLLLMLVPMMIECVFVVFVEVVDFPIQVDTTPRNAARV